MEPIKRPGNVHVPRSVNRRIEARRALQGGSAEDMRSTLRALGEKVPSSAKKEDLEAALYEVARGGNALTVDEPATKAATTTRGGE